MNNKGFTLIELIMVIALLAIISLLSVPNIVKTINKNKVDNYNSTIDSIIEATKLYVSDNRYSLTFDGNCSSTLITAEVKLSTLINSKDISSPVKNFCTDEVINDDTTIIIKLDCKTKQFSYDIDVNTSENTLKRKSEDGTFVEGIEGLKIDTCDELY